MVLLIQFLFYLQCDLSLEEVQGGIRLLSAVARINAALDTNSPSQLWLYLSDTATHLQVLHLLLCWECVENINEFSDIVAIFLIH